MTPCTTRHAAAALATSLAVLAAASAHAAPGGQGAVFDGYGAFYATLPHPLFDTGDARPMAAVGGDPDHPRATWSGTIPGVKGEHKIDLRETTPVVDGRSLFARPESVFPGAFTVALGSQATLYANERALCFEGAPSAGSGTADRYVQVTLVLLPFKPAARRYELPRLFGSCLGITQDDGQPVGFLAAKLRSPDGAPTAQGVDFASWTIGPDGGFHAGTEVLHASFPDPVDVFRFRLDPPAGH